MPTRSSIAMVLACTIALFASACGAPCQNVISAQRLLRDGRTANSDGRPHAQLRLPHNRLNLLLASALSRSEIAAELEIVKSLPLPALRAVAKRIEIKSAPSGSLGFDIDVALKLGDTELLALTTNIEARTELVHTGSRSTLVIGFDADSLRSVQPRYPDGAVDAIAAILGPAIKLKTGREVPKPLLRPLTRTMLAHVTGDAFGLVRDHVLARVGEVAALRIDLGNAPIERVQTRGADTAQAALVIDIYSRLPVLVGLSEAPTSPDPISGTGRLRIAGGALAELGNWSIAEGLAAQSYDSELHPDPDGAYVPVYDWREGEQPLVIHAFRIKSPCSTILIGARPEVAALDGKLSVGIADGSIEEVQGSTLVRMGVGLKNLFGEGISKTESGSASAAFEIGGRPVTARILDASIDGKELDLTVELAFPDA